MATNLETLLQNLETARKNATQGEWKTEYRTFELQKTPYSDRTSETCHRVYADNDIRFPIANTLGHQKYEFDVNNCELIALSANHILQLIEIIRVQNKALEKNYRKNHECYSCDCTWDSKDCIAKVEAIAKGEK